MPPNNTHSLTRVQNSIVQFTTGCQPRRILVSASFPGGRSHLKGLFKHFQNADGVISLTWGPAWLSSSHKPSWISRSWWKQFLLFRQEFTLTRTQNVGCNDNGKITRLIEKHFGLNRCICAKLGEGLAAADWEGVSRCWNLDSYVDAHRLGLLGFPLSLIPHHCQLFLLGINHFTQCLYSAVQKDSIGSILARLYCQILWITGAEWTWTSKVLMITLKVPYHRNQCKSAVQ